jgi:O-antigen/teichoic acid export membrane protein
LDGAVIFWIIIGVFREEIFFFLYGGKYIEYANMMLFMGLLPVSAGVVAVIGGAMRAMEKPNLIFRSYTFTCIIALTVGLLLLIILGVNGAALAMLLSYLVTSIIIVYFYYNIYSYDINRELYS